MKIALFTVVYMPHTILHRTYMDGVFMRLTWPHFQYHKPTTAWLSFSQFINGQNAKLCMITDESFNWIWCSWIWTHNLVVSCMYLICVWCLFLVTQHKQQHRASLFSFQFFTWPEVAIAQWATGAGHNSHEFESQTGRMFHGNDFKSSETQLILLSRFSYGLGYLLLVCVLGCWSESDLAACCI